MQITITLDTESKQDMTALAALVSNLSGDAPSPAAAAKTTAKKTAAAPPKDEPKTDEDSSDDAAAGNDGETLEDAVKMATELVSSGQAAKVKAALATVGAKRVSEIPEDKVADFIAELG